jgi:hypothetical protein
MQRTDRTLYYEVKVRSVVRPRLRTVGILEFGATPGQLGVLAGALAEGLCEKYHDTLEPSAAARTAEQLARELAEENPHVYRGDAAPRATDTARAASLARER